MQWDTLNNLRDAIVNQPLWFGAAGVFVVLVFLAAYSFSKSRVDQVITVRCGSFFGPVAAVGGCK